MIVKAVAANSFSSTEEEDDGEDPAAVLLRQKLSILSQTKCHQRGCIFRISLVSKDTKESASQMGFGQVWRGKLSKNGQLHSGH